jgi:tRNA-2-methylthio-N6-dimethylallyladenosine synthase
MSERLVDAIASYDNICNYIHLPVQSGSNRILQLMNRKYTREHYLSLIEMLKDNLTEYAISTDIIAGYPSETLADHNDTMSLMADVRYSSAFMFRYSPRGGTKSYKEVDDVPEEEKIRRLNEIILQQNNISHELNQQDIGKVFEILVEAPSKKKITEWIGRTKTAKLVIFDNAEGKYKVGDLLNVKIEKATSATLFGALANE